MKKILALMGAVLLLSVNARAVEVSAPSAVLMEKETGTVLFAKNEHEKLEPASVTKIMTLLLTMEAIDGGTLRYEDTVTASPHACSMGGSQIWLKEGERLTVDEMLKAVCVVSANDCAVALAEHLAGSEEAFVERMNRRAAELGMNDTTFKNACGLPVEGHVTSAYDIALMSRELMLHHPDIRTYTTVWMDTLRDGASSLVNTNKLVRFYDGTTGLKTGSTSAAGYCISATAEREGMELIAVILKGKTSPERFADAQTLLNYGFATYALKAAAAGKGDAGQSGYRAAGAGAGEQAASGKGKGRDTEPIRYAGAGGAGTGGGGGPFGNADHHRRGGNGGGTAPAGGRRSSTDHLSPNAATGAADRLSG